MPQNSNTLAELIQRDTGEFELHGDLTLASVSVLARATKHLFSTAPSITIDLSGIQQVQSAGLALLLDWQAQAIRAACQLNYVNWPPALVRIAVLSNLDRLLELTYEPALSETPLSAPHFNHGN